MSQHARLSASQTKQWSECPGSVAIREAFSSKIDDPSNEAAQLGTCAHALVERCLEKGEIPVEYHGRLIEIVNPDTNEEGVSILRANAKWPKSTSRVVFEVDDDMVEATSHMVFYIHRRCVELGLLSIEDSGTDLNRAKGVVKLIKKKVVRLESKVIPLPDRDDTGGTADVTIDAWPEILETVDYKNGSGVFVPVKNNMQLRSYSLGNLNLLHTDDYDTVRYTICQPRHYMAPDDGIMWEETTPAELREWQSTLYFLAKVVDTARNRMAEMPADTDIMQAMDCLHDQGMISAGEDGSHCFFCPLKLGCPAAKKVLEDQARIDFADPPDEISIEQLEVDEDDEQMRQLMAWVPFIDGWLKKATAWIDGYMLTGGQVDGLKVVRGKSSGRKWRSELDEKEIIKLMKGFGVARASLYVQKDPKMITGVQAEKLVSSGDERDRFNEDMLFKPEGKLTVALESDKRDAVEIDIASDFADDEMEDF